MTRQNSQSGFVLLITCIVLLAIGTSVAASLLVVGVWESKSVLSFEAGTAARAHADACLEIALGKLRLDESYEGAETVDFSPGSCTRGAVSLNESTYTISSTGEISNAVRRVRAQATRTELTGNVSIVRWEEVSEF